MTDIKLRRSYEAPTETDGCRILVDRIWPRGVTKAELKLDAWLKELAPSTGLRRWFGHDPARWLEFKKRYTQELQGHGDMVEDLRSRCRNGTVTLIYGAKDTEHNNAVVLRDYLEQVPERPS